MSIAGYRLSPQQKHLWRLHAGTQGGAYVSQVRIDLRGPLDTGRLEAALASLVERFEILRTSFQVPAGMNLPLQVIAAQAQVALDVHEGRSEGAESLARLAAEQRRPFDLSQAPLLRAALVRHADADFTLYLALPAYCADAAGLDLLVQDLAQAYAGVEELEEEALQYADLAEWMNETLEDEESAAQGEFWYGQIVAAPVAVPLPFERVPEDPARFEPRRLQRILADPARKRLEALAESCGAGPEALYLAVFQAFVQRLTGQDEFVMGLGCHGRTYEELESAPGPFARFLPLHARVESGMRLADRLPAISQAVEEAYDRQEYFSWDLAASAGGDSPLPFFALTCEYLPALPALEAGGLHWQVADRRALPDRFTLKLSCYPLDEGLQVDLYDDGVLFDPQAAEAMADRFLRLLEGLGAAPEAPFGSVDITGEEERRQMLEGFNRTQAPLSAEGTVVERIAAQAARTPGEPAVIFNGQALSYAGLEARAGTLARRLGTLGLGPGQFAGLYSRNSTEMFVGLLAILKAGGAYLPLDPDYPPERIAFMLADSGARVVLAQSALAPDLKAEAPEGVKVVALDAAGGTGEGAPALLGPAQDDLAYLIYTSGSTGKPKGVPVRHRNLAHSLGARLAYYEQPVGRYLLPTSFAFDSSVAGIFWALATGGALVLPQAGMVQDPAYLADLVKRQSVTHTLMLPALYGLLLDQDPAALASLETVIVAGEACPPGLVEKHFARLPGAALYNEYGPTEATVWATVHRLTGEEGRMVPIGKPIPGSQVYLLNESGLPAPLGSPGELVIGGPGVVDGYHGRPEETAERFIRMESISDGPLYRSGDLARWALDGSLHYLGRADSQVKIRGYRVEPGEVEALLAGHNSVREAAVVVREDSPGDRRLVAYVVPAGDGGAQTDALRSYLGGQLPAYMLPAIFVTLDQLPRTPSGKIDRRRLPAPDRGRRDTGAAYVAPSGPVEELLAGIWAEVLDLDQVGAGDNFFALGGHSILVTQLVSRLREALPVDLPLRTIFDHPSVGELAALLLSGERRAEIERTAELTLKVAGMSEGEVDALLGE